MTKVKVISPAAPPLPPLLELLLRVTFRLGSNKKNSGLLKTYAQMLSRV